MSHVWRVSHVCRVCQLSRARRASQVIQVWQMCRVPQASECVVGSSAGEWRAAFSSRLWIT